MLHVAGGRRPFSARKLSAGWFFLPITCDYRITAITRLIARSCSSSVNQSPYNEAFEAGTTVTNVLLSAVSATEKMMSFETIPAGIFGGNCQSGRAYNRTRPRETEACCFFTQLLFEPSSAIINLKFCFKGVRKGLTKAHLITTTLRYSQRPTENSQGWFSHIFDSSAEGP